ncbi:MAG: N-6 DNA methylase, partial [Planctomycetes bacterium]|nr:N-6 DNA methylase [Planctomycetota bacterium]
MKAQMHPKWEANALQTLGPASDMLRAAINELARARHPRAQKLAPNVQAALAKCHGSDIDVARLYHALRTYYTVTVLETAKLLAPHANVVAGTGAEEYAAAWPEKSATLNLLRRHCRLFVEAALTDGQPHDLFRALYEALFPRELRHANGEYYTPGWVARLTLDRVGFSGREKHRLLDPSCGSGVFLINALHRVKKRGLESLDNIFGFDINPLAVLTARVNILACLGEQARRTRKIPNVFRRDCILDDPAPTDPDRPFEFVVGNPPWVLWDNLPATYREQTAQLWKRYGLFNLPAAQARLGGGKKDLAMLFTYAAVHKHLAPGGRIAFVINQAILQSVRAGAGFRRFKIGDTGADLQVVHFDDLTALRLFDAAARPGIIVMQKGPPTTYPIPYTIWTPTAEATGFSQDKKFARPVSPAHLDSPWE